MPDTREEAEGTDRFSHDHANIGADRTRDRQDDAEREEKLASAAHDTRATGRSPTSMASLPSARPAAAAMRRAVTTPRRR